ncbi:formate dehydrogenase accessory sulfurtransferase FdhD [Photobacterium sp. 1_MG-2023]|uniref:formate dehydrogenase accessory sulfurtransferase FdhD n=1 Tax=Photobacterium sp. 1_MG-2023 TaxID=3062646 RepID=UPI0026E43A47|nr:formate dehydrogenase accessory sulfurtransferase FdhD [Photobacterium sp. 1_MG-2023]MDO6706504.1 formate dehydrogenase accessory sulfurtransferase FdhD [Photobacterium sp. 1_MG-2023]
MSDSDNKADDMTDVNAAPPSPDAFIYVELLEDDSATTTYSAVLASETALSISYNGISQAVMMVTPGNIEDFVKGFSLSNDIVRSVSEIYEITLTAGCDSHHAEVEISNRAFWSLKDHRRQLAGTSGCGICGVEAIEQALPPLTPLTPVPPPQASLLHNLRARISAAQEVARSSGALHAALYVDAEGDIQLCREDIGRHNALDKLIGAMATERIDPQSGFTVMTSRCSLELIQKAVRAKIGTLVSLSAPTAMTVRWARHNNLNLIHLPHRSAPRLYSGSYKKL